MANTYRTNSKYGKTPKVKAGKGSRRGVGRTETTITEKDGKIVYLVNGKRVYSA